MNRPEEIKEEDLGLRCGLFEVEKIGDESAINDSLFLNLGLYRNCFDKI